MREEYVYGINVIDAILKYHPIRLLELYITDPELLHEQLTPNHPKIRIINLIETCRQHGIAVQYVKRTKLDGWFPDQVHQGIAAKVRPLKILSADILKLKVQESINKGHAPLLLVLDGVTDPHNLGACWRTAACVGADALIVPKFNSAGITALVYKIASGASEVVPLVVVNNLSKCLAGLKDLTVIVGTDVAAEASIFNAAVAGPVTLVMGSEGAGLKENVKKQCDLLVNIPMKHQLSLNVSVATGICLFELQRQKQSAAI